MPTLIYARKNQASGAPGTPRIGNPSFTSGIVVALPGRNWSCLAADDDVSVTVDGAPFTPTEEADLDVAYAAWAPGATQQYQGIYEVTTVQAGHTQKVEWFQTDDGDGAYSDLARASVYNWEGSKLLSVVTTIYYTDGGVVSEETESFFTTNNGQRVRKVI